MNAAQQATLDLFSAPEVQTTSCVVAANDSPISPEVSPLKAYWLARLDCLRRRRETAAILRSMDIAAFPLTEKNRQENAHRMGYRANEAVRKREEESMFHAELCEEAKNLFSKILSEATFAYANPDLQFTLPTDEIREHFQEELKNPERFDPDQVWAYLASNFGKETMDELAYQQAASKLVRLFGLQHRAPEFKTGGRMVLRKYVFTSIWNGRHELSHGSRADIGYAMEAFTSFQEWWNGDKEAIQGFGYHKGHFQSMEGKYINTREKFQVTKDLCVVTFLKNFEFIFSPAASEQFQIFLTMFAGDQLMSK